MLDEIREEDQMSASATAAVVPGAPGGEIPSSMDVVPGSPEDADGLSLLQERVAQDIDVSNIVFDEQTKNILR